jgi:hypothetical protein
VPGLLKVTVEGESFNSVSLMTMVLSVLAEAPFVVVVAAQEEESYFPPPVVDLPELVALPVLESPLQAEDSPSPHRRRSLQAQPRAQA